MHVCWANDKAHVSTLTGGRGRLLKSRCIAFTHTHGIHGFRTYSPAILYQRDVSERFQIQCVDGYSMIDDGRDANVGFVVHMSYMWKIYWLHHKYHSSFFSNWFVLLRVRVRVDPKTIPRTPWMPVHHRAACAYTPPGNAQNYIKTITWDQNHQFSEWSFFILSMCIKHSQINYIYIAFSIKAYNSNYLNY